MKARDLAFFLLRILSLIALIFASALAVDYYFSSNTFCASGASCEVVAKSDFGQKYGKFLPTMGLVMYSVVFFATFFTKLLHNRILNLLFAVGVIAAACGAMIFVCVQYFEIKAFCWLCMGIDTSALVSIVPALILLKYPSGNPEEERPKLSVLSWIALWFAVVALPLSWGIFKPHYNQTDKGAPEFVKSHFVEGKVNIVEVSSFMCPHCKHLHKPLEGMLDKYADKVHFARVTFSFLKSNPHEIPLAYECVKKFGKEKEFTDLMFANKAFEGEALQSMIAQSGVDTTKVAECVKDPEMLALVKKQREFIASEHFKGAPTVWIQDRVIIGYDERKGMEPYETAIISGAQSGNSDAIPFYGVILLSILLFAAGFFVHRKKNSETL